MATTEHTLTLIDGPTRVGPNSWARMACHDCDLRVSFQIRPVAQADDFVRVLTEAHHRQIAEAPDDDA